METERLCGRRTQQFCVGGCWGRVLWLWRGHHPHLPHLRQIHAAATQRILHRVERAVSVHRDGGTQCQLV